MSQLFEIPAVAMGVLEDKLDKLNKKAKKYGIAPNRLVTVGRTEDTLGRLVYLVAVEGEPVQFKGWTFLARLDHNTDPSGTSNLVYTMPGEELPEALRLSPAKCEHCGYDRKRKDTFVMRNDEDGTLIQVGRTCLRDFFGHDPAEVARRAQFITKIHDAAREASEGGQAYLTSRRHIDLEEFLGYVAMSIEEHGWVSGREAWQDPSKVSTRNDALDTMFCWPHPMKFPKANHKAAAQAAIAHCTTLDPAKSDFNFNIVQLAKSIHIDGKAAGTAAAMMFIYNRHLEQEANKKAGTDRPDFSKSEYVGTEKERLTLDVTILSSRMHEGFSGYYSITRMLDEKGNLFVSFGAFSAEAGEKLKVRGTVKRHQDYNGIKQTVINRVMAA